MITTHQLDVLLKKHTFLLPTHRLSLDNACGKCLREDLFADRDLPPFDRVTMDGIAIAYATWKKGQRQFAITSLQHAGMPATRITDHACCIECATGSVLPVGYDCIIPYEDIRIRHRTAMVVKKITVSRHQNIHRQATDCKKNTRILNAGCILSPPQIALAATIGKIKIRVSRMPRIAIIATGDELVPLAKTPRAYQIRRSNGHGIAAALQMRGYHALSLSFCRDTRDALSRRIRTVQKRSDVIIVIGGASKGCRDFLRSALASLHADIHVHGVAQRPGKPFLFATKGRTAFFGLPGNPISAHINTYRHILPFLARMQGTLPVPEEYVPLSQKITTTTDYTLYMPVTLSHTQQHQLTAHPHPMNCSGDNLCLATSTGFIELAAQRRCYPKGSYHRLYRWNI